MRPKSGNHMVDLLFTLALFCVFAATALLVVLIGANVYKGTVAQMDENFSARTSVTYVATKIRQNDVENGVAVTELAGVPALLLTQNIEGELYETWIYHYDGAVREVFTQGGNPLNPGDGQAIVEIPRFTIAREGGAVALTCEDGDGNITRQVVTPRCGLAGAAGTQEEAAA